MLTSVPLFSLNIICEPRPLSENSVSPPRCRPPPTEPDRRGFTDAVNLPVVNPWSGSLNPDSLNPDPLNPDPLNPGSSTVFPESLSKPFKLLSYFGNSFFKNATRSSLSPPSNLNRFNCTII